MSLIPSLLLGNSSMLGGVLVDMMCCKGLSHVLEIRNYRNCHEHVERNEMQTQRMGLKHLVITFGVRF